MNGNDDELNKFLEEHEITEQNGTTTFGDFVNTITGTPPASLTITRLSQTDLLSRTLFGIYDKNNNSMLDKEQVLSMLESQQGLIEDKAEKEGFLQELGEELDLDQQQMSMENRSDSIEAQNPHLLFPPTQEISRRRRGSLVDLLIKKFDSNSEGKVNFVNFVKGLSLMKKGIAEHILSGIDRLTVRKLTD